MWSQVNGILKLYYQDRFTDEFNSDYSDIICDYLSILFHFFTEVCFGLTMVWVNLIYLLRQLYSRDMVWVSVSMNYPSITFCMDQKSFLFPIFYRYRLLSINVKLVIGEEYWINCMEVCSPNLEAIVPILWIFDKSTA